MTSTTPTILALARLPGVAAAWFFAASQGGLLGYGPTRSDHHGLPVLRDLREQISTAIDEVIVAVPPILDHDDVRSELRRVPALSGARLRIVTVTAADIASAIGMAREVRP